MSFVGWLDYSEDEQRRVRELLQAFQDPGTVDDLGIGTLRDAISNRLFPGTSVIQTRARYFLFVPWIFQHVAEGSADVLQRVEYLERRLIRALKESDDQDGLIGRVAGMNVRTLPSTIYWSGLVSYGIFQRPELSRTQYARRARTRGRRTAAEDELAERRTGFWHGDIPPPPDGFFEFKYADFRLTAEEARWLSERVLSRENDHGPCLLGDHVRRLRGGKTTLPRQFWKQIPPGTCSETRRLVQHAERFSLLVEGAAIVYNLMLHELRDDADREDPARVSELRKQLNGWARDATAADLPGWTQERDEFFELVDPLKRIPLPTRSFAAEVMDFMASHPLDTLGRNRSFRDLIKTRELQNKKQLARLRGGPRLDSWQGNSGLQPLDFRWGQVRRFLSDLEHGLFSQTGQRSHARAAD